MNAGTGVETVSDVRDLSLADQGKRRMEWTFQQMPVLQAIRKQLIKEQPLAGIRVSVCLKISPSTANLVMALRDGGAEVALTSDDTATVEDDIAATLVRDYGIRVCAIRDSSAQAVAAQWHAVLDNRPKLVMDSKGDFTAMLIDSRQELLAEVKGVATEHTSATIRALARQGQLQFPIVVSHDANTRRLFDNRYGTGQSVLDAIIRTANLLINGLAVVVAGYGWCGRGIATKARSMGANVIITESDPLKALEAVMDGNRVMSMADAAAVGDLFITATGNKNVITRDHFERLKQGAILVNAGHSNVEIDLEMLTRMASTHRQTREFVEEYSMRDGRKLFLLGGGRVINSAAGHPVAVADMIVAGQVLCMIHLAKTQGQLENKLYPVPDEIDLHSARLKLDTMGVKTDKLTLDQEAYLGGASDAL